MTLSLSRFTSVSAILLGALYTALTFTAATAPAPAMAKSNVYYSVELTHPTDERRAVAGGVAWTCKGTTCVAAKGNSRPMRMCRELRRELGEVATFKSGGKVLADDRLAKCNG